MSFLKFIRKRAKKDNINLADSESIIKKITSAHEKCRNNIKKEQGKVYELKNIVNKIIADVFFVSSEYWYDEYRYFDEIKKHYENKKLDITIIEKTENTISQYFYQIELCKSKIDFLESLLAKYDEMEKKIRENIEKSLELKREEEKINLLKKYTDKLKSFREYNEDTAAVYEKSEQLKQLDVQIAEIEEDFNVKREVKEYMDKITSDFFDEETIFDSKVITEEMRKLKNKIDANEKTN